MDSHAPSDPREVIATWRFQVIAPLVVRPLEKGERTHLLRDLSSRLWTTPDGRTVRLHPRTLTRWVARYRQYGYAGLMPEPRRGSGPRSRLPEAVLSRAIELRREDPRRSVRTLIRILELEGLAPPGEVKRTTLNHALCRSGASRAELSFSVQTFRLRESPYPNALWQIDTQVALYLPDACGRRRTLYLVACLDDYSRHVIARFYLHDNRPSLADLLKRAILSRGKPEIVYVDNGANFRSQMLEQACAQLAIDLRHSRPYRPQGRGKVERFFRTADTGFHREAQALIDHGTLTALDQVQDFFLAWLSSEYNRRVHSATGETPEQRLGHVHPDHPLVWVDPQTLARAFRWTQSRKVSAVGTVSIEGNVYQVDPALARRRVTVRFDPYDLSRVEVEWEGRSYGWAEPLDLSHAQSREVPLPTPPAAPAPQTPRTPFLKMIQAQEEEYRAKTLTPMAFTAVTPPLEGGGKGS